MHGDAGMEARDFPAGDGDAFDDVAGGLVDGLIDGKEAFDEAGVFLALLIAEDGGVRGTKSSSLVACSPDLMALRLEAALPWSLVGPWDLAPFSRAIRARSFLDICCSFFG